jgi:hypothetical protein
MAIHLLIAIVAIWLILVGMYIDPIDLDINTLSINTTGNDTDWSPHQTQQLLKEVLTSEARKSASVASKAVGISFVTIFKVTWHINVCTYVYVFVLTGHTI